MHSLSSQMPVQEGYTHVRRSRPRAAVEGSGAVMIRENVMELAKHMARNTPFRKVDCMQTDSRDTDPEQLCFMVCVIPADKGDLTSGYDRIQPYYPGALLSGGKELLQWIVWNQPWLQKITPFLSQNVTVASIRINAGCNIDALDHHLGGPLWRVVLLDGTTLQELRVPVAGYQVVMPLPIDDRTQDCMMKYEIAWHTVGGAYTSLPRSSLTGYCMMDNLSGWVSATSLRVYPPSLATPFPTLALIFGGCALLFLAILALCLRFLPALHPKRHP